MSNTIFSFLFSKIFVWQKHVEGICYRYIGNSQVALVVKNLPADARDKRDASSVPGLRRSPGGGHGNPLQYSCLENLMDREAWWATVHRAAKESDITEVT